jgi:hypothetical protein
MTTFFRGWLRASHSLLFSCQVWDDGMIDVDQKGTPRVSSSFLASTHQVISARFKLSSRSVVVRDINRHETLLIPLYIVSPRPVPRISPLSLRVCGLRDGYSGLRKYRICFWRISSPLTDASHRPIYWQEVTGNW